MVLIKQLTEKIEAIETEDNCLVVAVCGAADLGKSHLSAQLTDAISQRGLSANHLTLDSYLMGRSDRISGGLSGYQPESYDLSSVQKDLTRFRDREPITHFPYDHSVGIKFSNKETINSCSILFVDGLHSMNELLMPLINFSIFVCTTDNQLKQIRLQADITKRKQAISFSQKNSVIEFRKYKQYVEPYKDRANVVLSLKKQWEYVLLE